MHYSKPVLQRQSCIVAIVFVFLFFLNSQLYLLTLFGWNRPSFFFENATPGIIAEGHPQADLFRTDVTKLQELLITRYIKWHNAQITATKSGFGRETRLRTLIFVGNGGDHGLGDRFRGILYAYLCSVFSDRILLIKWEDPFPLSTIFQTGVDTNFTYDPVYFAPQILLNGSFDEVHVRYAKSLLDLPMFLSSAGTVWMECEPRPKMHEVFRVAKRFPYLKTSRELRKLLPLQFRPSHPEMFPLFLKALFRPSVEFRKMMSEPIAHHNRLSISRFWKNSPLRKISLTHPYVSVHARLGHGVGEHMKRFDLEKLGLTVESLADCMAARALALTGEVNITDPPRFYLATDTVEFRILLKRALLRRNSRTKLMYGSWGVAHVKNLRKDASDLKQYFYTMMDIFLLSMGKGALCSRSGFCNLAVWMGGIRSTSLFREAKCKEWMAASRVVR